MDEQDIDDLKTDIGRAFKAAIFSTDYWILRTILDTSKELKSAYEKNNFQIMNYILNKGFWDIGVCINNKLNNYSSVMPEFFDDISVNINNYFKTERNIS